MGGGPAPTDEGASDRGLGRAKLPTSYTQAAERVPCTGGGHSEAWAGQKARVALVEAKVALAHDERLLGHQKFAEERALGGVIQEKTLVSCKMIGGLSRMEVSVYTHACKHASVLAVMGHGAMVHGREGGKKQREKEEKSKKGPPSSSKMKPSPAQRAHSHRTQSSHTAIPTTMQYRLTASGTCSFTLHRQEVLQ